MATRRQVLTLAAAFALAPAAQVAWGQSFPSRPVRIVVGFAPGGNFDIVARLLAQWLSEQLLQPVVVENRPGAGSNLATESVIRAAADGYTLLLGGTVNAINATLYEQLAFNFARDVAAVAGVTRFPNVMAVDATLPVRTVPEFIAYARTRPGQLNQGSSGKGTSQHLAGELFKRMAEVDFVHVPYKGASQAISALLGGQVQVLFEPLPASMPHIKSGKLRALAVTTAARSDALPEVPALSEFASGYEASGWTCLCAPRGTPAAVVETLNRATNAGLADPRLKARLAELGATTLAGSPAELTALIAEETEKWGKVIRAANIKPE